MSNMIKVVTKTEGLADRAIYINNPRHSKFQPFPCNFETAEKLHRFFHEHFPEYCTHWNGTHFDIFFTALTEGD